MVVSKSGSSKRMTMGGCAEKLRQLIAFDAVRTRTAYAEAMFEVESPGGKVTLRVGHAEGKLPPSVRGRRLTVVMAHNPGAERPEEEANRLANERLRAAIEVDGWTYWPAVGRIPSGDHAEPSFAVLDITEERTRELGAQFEQVCVFYWDGERGSLVWCE